MSQLNKNQFDNFIGYNYPADPNYGLGNGLGDYVITTTTDGTTILDENKVYIGDSSNNIYIGDLPPDNQSSGGPIWISQPNQCFPSNPSPWIGSSSGTITINSGDTKYSVVDLPRDGMPIAVFVAGRMVTLGVLGTDVECAFTGDKLVFSPGVIAAINFGRNITMSIEYADEILHYNVGNNGYVEYEENSSRLVVRLVSTIKKAGAITGAK